MRRPAAIWLSAAVIALPASATALGCFPLTVEDGIARDYAAAQATPQPVVVLRGTVDHDVAYQTDEDPFRFEATFEGRQLTPEGEGNLFETTVIIDGQCINGDCGALGPSGAEQHFLALFDDGGFRIEVFPCSFFPNAVTPVTAAALSTCLAGGCSGD